MDEKGIVRMDELKFRLANQKDYAGIKDLSDGMYNDIDYTTSSFSQWLSDPRWATFVAESRSGHIVGFVAFHLINEGSSVVERSARVDAAYRGRGVYKQLHKFSLSWLEERYPLQTEISARDIVRGNRTLLEYSHVTVICRPCTNEKYFLDLHKIAEGISSKHSKFLIKAMQNCQNCSNAIFRNGIVMVESEIYRTKCESDLHNLASRPKLFSIVDGPEPSKLGTNVEKYSEESIDFCHCDNKEFNKVDDTFPTSHHSVGGTECHVKLYESLALLDLTGKETNLGLPLYSIDFYGRAVTWFRKAVVSSILAAWEETRSEPFCLSVQAPLDFENAMLKVFESLKFCEVVYAYKVYIGERDLN